MNSNGSGLDPARATLAIYGPRDLDCFARPLYIHDHSLVWMEGGEVIRLLQLERLTRRKHDNQLHRHLETLLDGENLPVSKPFDLVVVDSFAGRSFITDGGQLRYEAPLTTTLSTEVEKGWCLFREQEQPGYSVSHELAHVSSNLPFFGPFRENSLLLHVDGGARTSTCSVWVYRDGRIKLVKAHSELAYLSRLFHGNPLMHAILGEAGTHCGVPGKLMALASFGNYRPEVLGWLRRNQYFEAGLDDVLKSDWEDSWRVRSGFFESARREFGYEKAEFDTRDSFFQDIAAAVQHEFTSSILNELSELQELTKTQFLYLSGGCALNIVTNSQIRDSNIFEDLFIPPCCNDSGLALGAAAYVEWIKHGDMKPHSPFLNNWGLADATPRYDRQVIQEAAASLAVDKKVLGVCNGFGEVGPRALGNRSILAAADSADLRDKVSIEHKGREWYRPVAPVMRAEAVKRFTGMTPHHLSKFMLLQERVLPEYRRELEGAVHVNGTARIQTIFSRDDNPFLHDLLLCLEEEYGKAALLNTSFNAGGEPIVHTEVDALASARRMRLDACILNGRLLHLN